MATFGYTTQGGSVTPGRSNALVGSEFTGVNGTIEKITSRFLNGESDFFSFTETGDVRAVILKGDETILSNGVSDLFTDGSIFFAWNDFVFTTNPSVLSSDNYILCLIGEPLNSPPASTENGLQINYDVGDSDQGLLEDSGDNSITSPANPSSPPRNDYKLSIYATYEASGDPDPDPITKVKVAGTFVPIAPKVKLSGTFVEKTPQIKQGGSFS